MSRSTAVTDDGTPPSPSSTDRRGLVVVGIITVLVLGVLFSRSGDDDGGDSARSQSSSSLAVVTYFVTGTADSIDITMETPGGTSQQSSLEVPLQRKDGTRGLSFSFRPGAFVYISAQNQGSSGTVTCRIEGTGGIVIAETTSSGAYTIATCDGRAL